MCFVIQFKLEDVVVTLAAPVPPNNTTITTAGGIPTAATTTTTGSGVPVTAQRRINNLSGECEVYT